MCCACAALFGADPGSEPSFSEGFRDAAAPSVPVARKAIGSAANMLGSRATVAASWPGKRCPQVSIVSTIVECRITDCTALGWAPAIANQAPQVCRRLWKSRNSPSWFFSARKSLSPRRRYSSWSCLAAFSQAARASATSVRNISATSVRGGIPKTDAWGAFVAMWSRSNPARAGWMYCRASWRFFVAPALQVMKGSSPSRNSRPRVRLRSSDDRSPVWMAVA
ncbi:MAG: hypothetical protein ABSG86_19250 [Thermoguttaceae bacterium]